MKIPTATYRLQFTSAFTFNDAKNIVSYLNELGISDIYASPVLQAKNGSTHGYDAVTPTVLNAELGTSEDFETLAGEVKNCNMAWLQDIVPNHMSFTSQNAMLMDVLESGPNSVYLDFFDIEWNHAYESIKGRLLIPTLGKFYSEALESGELQLKFSENGFSINYYEHCYPIRLESYAKILTHRVNRLKKRMGAEDADYIKFLGILYVLKNLEPKEELEERVGQVKFSKRILWELYTQNDEIKKFIDKNISLFNGEPGKPESFNLLDELLSEQFYRLSYWKVANEEINYRRFFIVNELISLKIDVPEVFDYIHSLIFELMDKGLITGLRIDHIDGLYEPFQYLCRLREKRPDNYIVVEKILEYHEDLPSEWPIQGTTGYEFLNFLNGLFCRPESEKAFTEIYSGFTRFNTEYEELVYQKKRMMISHQMTGDIDNLAHLIKRISGKYRHGNDITLHGLRSALVEILSLYPVYRSYVHKDNFENYDYTYVTETINKAVERVPDLYHELKFIEHFLTYVESDNLTTEEKADRLRFIMRFQQFTGPLMAKGFEDTALYIYNRLLSLNEVGSSPDKFGITPEEFHGFNKKRTVTWPNTLNTTSTHDMKRGEDVRARLNVLSELPQEWQEKLNYWSGLNKDKKKTVNRKRVPDANDEYLIYQAIIGSFPFYENEFSDFTGRLKEFIIKAIREAKVYTAWIKPDSDYEDCCMAFIDEILEQSEDNLFLNDIKEFQKKTAYYGVFNSLSQTLLKVTSPGVSDFYQGCELWDLSFVDPDNRRPVEFEKHRVYLQELKNRAGNDNLKLIEDLLAHCEDGKIKLYLVYKALNFKKENEEIFKDGTYIPLAVKGKYAGNIIAFARAKNENWAITVVPRFLTGLIEAGNSWQGSIDWQDTAVILPDNAPAGWNNVITGHNYSSDKFLKIAELLKDFPVALLSE